MIKMEEAVGRFLVFVNLQVCLISLFGHLLVFMVLMLRETEGSYGRNYLV